jgi:hypothetical protein
MELLQPRMKREMATRIVQGLLKGGTRVASLDKVEMLFRWAWGGVGDRPSSLILGVAMKPQHPSPQGFPSALTCPAAALLPPPCSFIAPLVRDMEGLQDLLDEEASGEQAVGRQTAGDSRLLDPCHICRLATLQGG